MDLKKIQQKFTKKFGAHFISTAEDEETLARIPYGISTQSLSLDLMIGRPGLPAGRLTEIVGLTNTGKSSLSYAVMAECQRLGGEAILLETENAYEPERLRDLGVNTKTLIKAEPETLEQVLEAIVVLLEVARIDQKIKGPIVVVVDSIAGTPTQAQRDNDYGELSMGIAARVMADGLRKIIRPLAAHKAVLIFLNQLYASMQQYGSQHISYGGTQIQKSSSLRIRLRTRQVDLVKKGEQSLGTWTTADTIKNKIGTPFQMTKYLLNFDHGIDPIEDLWRASLRLGVLKTSKDAFQFSLNGKSAAIERPKFEEFVMSKFKTPHALRERLTKVAVEKKLIRVYGG